MDPETALQWDSMAIAHLRAMKAQGAFENRPALPADAVAAIKSSPELGHEDQIKSHFHTFSGSDAADIPSLVRAGLLTNVPTAVIKQQFDSWSDCFNALYDDTLFSAFLRQHIDAALQALRDGRVPPALESFNPDKVSMPHGDKPVFTTHPVEGNRPNHEGSIDALTDDEALWALHVIQNKPDIALTFAIFKDAVESYTAMLTNAAKTQSALANGAVSLTDARRLETMATNITSVMGGPFWERMILGRFCLLYAGRAEGDMTKDVEAGDFRMLIDYLRGNNFRGQAEQMDHNLRHVFRCPFHATFNRLTGWGHNLAGAYQAVRNAPDITGSACAHIAFYTADTRRRFLEAGSAQDPNFLPRLVSMDQNKRRGPSGPPADVE